ncbi:MAG TPA: c-type cytochrome domain-containing protein, partial [Luteolibacter sp.]|nr:c-type cytochrome domain-containing protein [Luteolibacter sp.]
MPPLPTHRLLLSAALALGLSGCSDKPKSEAPQAGTKPAEAPLPEKVTFNAHIRPIFSDTCFSCHGFDAKHRKADLRLDIPEGAYAKLKDSDARAIVPGKPEQSAVWMHVISNDPEEMMPPPEFHKPLSERQKSLIKRWIEQGAVYEKHWAYIPLTKPTPPTLAKHSKRVVNPIDAFILKRLEKENIEPSPQADRATLLRRLS